MIRSLPNNQLDSQVIKGGNDQVNAVITALAAMISQVGIDAFLPMAKTAAEQAGFDINSLLSEEESVEQ